MVTDLFNSESSKTLKKPSIGGKIVKVETNDGKGLSHLDDGTQLKVCPNDGCSCGSGVYWIEYLWAFDNVIADSGIKDPTIKIQGTKGNGLYGRGSWIRVVRSEGEM